MGVGPASSQGLETPSFACTSQRLGSSASTQEATPSPCYIALSLQTFQTVVPQDPDANGPKLPGGDTGEAGVVSRAWVLGGHWLPRASSSLLAPSAGGG